MYLMSDRTSLKDIVYVLFTAFATTKHFDHCNIHGNKMADQLNKRGANYYRKLKKNYRITQQTVYEPNSVTRYKESISGI